MKMKRERHVENMSRERLSCLITTIMNEMMSIELVRANSKTAPSCIFLEFYHERMQMQEKSRKRQTSGFQFEVSVNYSAASSMMSNMT